MQQRDVNISVNSNKPILFNHIIDTPSVTHNTFHIHDYLEIYIYLTGDVDFIVEENYISLKRGDIIITTQNVLHKPIIKSSQKYERFFIGIPLDALYFIDRGQNPLSFSKKDKVLISLSNEKFEQIFMILNRISDAIEDNSNQNTYLTFSYFLQFLDVLNSAFNSNEYDIENRKTALPVLINDVLKYIDTSSIRISSVNSLAETFHVNPSYLSSLFSSTTHVNLKQYLTNKKISEAKNMLLSDRAISDIAYECGFSSCSHFISVFKQITGKTPREYRLNVK